LTAEFKGRKSTSGAASHTNPGREELCLEGTVNDYETLVDGVMRYVSKRRKEAQTE
jgi:hypothetical protein